jgi:hypothetical protein
MVWSTECLGFSMNQSNEGRCCDAVLSIIEREQGARREILSMDTAASRGIEVRCKIGDALYALEHTLVDPYPEKRRDDQQFLRVMGEIEESLSGKGLLRTEGSYHVYVESHAFRGKKRSEIPAIREAIRAWVIANAQRSDPPAPGHTQELTGSPPTLPVRVRLQFTLWPPSGGKLLIGRMAPADLPQQRRERVGAALKKKGPKLYAEHRAGARTVLILEDNDSALSNPIDIGGALHAELARLDYGIDDVYLVETKLRDCWQVWRMKQGTKQWPTRYESPEFWELAPQDLKDMLTL